MSILHSVPSPSLQPEAGPLVYVRSLSLRRQAGVGRQSLGRHRPYFSQLIELGDWEGAGANRGGILDYGAGKFAPALVSFRETPSMANVIHKCPGCRAKVQDTNRLCINCYSRMLPPLSIERQTELDLLCERMHRAAREERHVRR